MSAFGRRPGTAGRPAFGVAKPMQGGPGGGGGQFPAIDAAPLPDSAGPIPELEAMERLNQRSTAESMEPAEGGQSSPVVTVG